MISQKDLDRLWGKVDKKGDDECWEWLGARSRNKKTLAAAWSPPRYSNLSYKVVRAIYQLTYGDIDPKVKVWHTCDNTLCCNPLHICADTVEERFWKKVDKKPGQGIGDCWEWTAGLTSGGYGGFRPDSSVPTTSASRIAYELTYKIKLPEDIFVCHKCDNRKCCNPAHLFVGTASDNAKDMMIKGRGRIGEKANAAKLTEQNVRDIKEMLNQKISCAEISRKYGVSATTIYHIRDGVTWNHLSDKGYKKRGLSKEQEYNIAVLLSRGIRQKDVAAQYSVSQQTISELKRKNAELIKKLKEKV